MEEESTACPGEPGQLTVNTQTTEDVPSTETKPEGDSLATNVTNVDNKDGSDDNKCNDESESEIKKEECKVSVDTINTEGSTPLKELFIEQEPTEPNDDARSLGDLDSLPVADELALGAAGSDSGVEGCGRALSSGGGSRSCASSVVSCGSGCGSESSSLAGAPPRPRRRVNVNVAEPKRSSPVSSGAPRPVTAPRGPNLATRERARSREKPTPPEKPRPLTPKPRIRPTADLPNLVRESPALRAKPTKTSTARCRTPNSPSEEKRWPANGPRLTTVADVNATRATADKYATLPRRRRDAEPDGSPKHEGTPPSSRRPTVTRSASSRSTIKTRVRIYAEKTSQTVLNGTDIESALAGIVPNIENVFFVQEACGARESARLAEARLAEAEREAAEMQDFLAAETGALSDSLREAEAELVRVNADLERR
ncbi:hypothetical protein HF086_017883 [Spodoptera exigua]|uniref:Uncharacterized protein n=1 Tax=Spodoptera exigua TaxID=7107 RepID=A0A922MFP0_SPOEX|nr:hypothetical protein HF086_017883 [Spodoptera exigua]